jgi:general secretion pathway protein K
MNTTSSGKKQWNNSRSGIALVIVMISVFVLTILAAGFAFSMKVETKLAQHANNETELQWIGRSGVQYAQWVLSLHGNCPLEPYDSLNQAWATGTAGGLCATNAGMTEIRSRVELGNGYFTWKIIDMERKWNINLANEFLLQQAMLLMGADPSEMTPVINSILDWIDPDNNARIQGTESQFYESLEPPYEAKNGPIDSLSELLLIRGVTQDLFWGSASSNHSMAAFQARENRLGFANARSISGAGLADLFSPIGGIGTRVNINTASADALQLIPGVDSRAAEAIVGARSGEDDGSGLTGPFRSVDPNYIFTRVPILPLPIARQISQFVDIRSRSFEVEVTAHVAGSERTYHALLYRVTPRDIQALNFYWKY